jgi:hypothetical protein
MLFVWGGVPAIMMWMAQVALALVFIITTVCHVYGPRTPNLLLLFRLLRVD